MAYLKYALQLTLIVLIWALVIRPDNNSAKSRIFFIQAVFVRWYYIDVMRPKKVASVSKSSLKIAHFLQRNQGISVKYFTIFMPLTFRCIHPKVWWKDSEMNSFTPETNFHSIKIYFLKANDLYSIYTECIRVGIERVFLRYIWRLSIL